MFLSKIITICLMVTVSSVGLAQMKDRVQKPESGKMSPAKHRELDKEKLQKHIRAIMKKIPTSPGVAVAIVLAACGFLALTGRGERTAGRFGTDRLLGSLRPSFFAPTAILSISSKKIIPPVSARFKASF